MHTSVNTRASVRPPVLVPETSDNNKLERARGWLRHQIALAARSGITAAVHVIDPARAEALLEINDSNRELRPDRVARYARQATDGEWDVNGETIKVSVCGHLNDGQHRLHAIVDADVPVSTLVVFGLERQTIRSLDDGLPRTGGDQLAMLKVANPRQVAAVAALVLQFQKSGSVIRSTLRAPSRISVTSRGASDTKIQQSVAFVPAKGSASAGGRTLLAFCHYILSEIDQTDADNFITRLIKGDALEIDSPIYTARQRLIQLTSSRSRVRVKPEVKVAIMFRAWNAYREGRSLTRIITTTKTPQHLPELV